MRSILAIVSKAIFERDGRAFGAPVGPGIVWATDRYVSTNKAFESLREGGRILLVTVRPPEQMWFVGLLESPRFDGSAWVARAPNRLPVTNISALRRTMLFESGKGLSQEEGMLAMSLQTPRALTEASATAILAAAGASKDVVEGATPPVDPAMAARIAALEAMTERHVVLFDKMQETHGLRLPRSVGHVAGFIAGLTPTEHAAFEASVGRFVGVGRWFDDADLPLAPGGDERLRDRRPSDPPEFVPVFATADESERWGLWYDDPAELPTGVAHWTPSNDPHGFRVRLTHRTLGEALRARLIQTSGAERDAIAAWLEEVLLREGAAPLESSSIPMRHRYVLGEQQIYLPDTADLASDLIGMDRRHLYAKRTLAAVEPLVERARAELREGYPARALFIGRELHAYQVPEWRLVCTELLIRAYQALDRPALADVVRASYRHDAPDQPIFVAPRKAAVVLAAESGDVVAMAEALAATPGPSGEDIEQALAFATTAEVIDALLDHDPTRSDMALRRHLRALGRARTTVDVGKRRPLAERLVQRGELNERAFARLLATNDADFVATATERVALDALGPSGVTALHLAASAGNAAVARRLLARGTDPRARTEEGRSAYDLARDAQLATPADPGPAEIMAMLQLAGGGLSKPPPPASDEIEYVPGDAVHHKKLGDGVVQTVTGEGEEAKLLIRFASETRVFLAKFVVPVA